MGRTWGRLYAGTRNHRKIKMLREMHPHTWQSWYVLIDMAIECDDDGWIYISKDLAYSPRQLAHELGIRTENALSRFCESLVKLELAQVENGFVKLSGYSRRNFTQDISTGRVRKFRENANSETFQKRFNETDGNVSETGRTEQNRTKQNKLLFESDGSVADIETKAQEKIAEKEKAMIPNPLPGPQDFPAFYKAYPKKQGRAVAEKSWGKMALAGQLPPLDDILSTLSKQIEKLRWTKENEQFIPLPSTYINQKRWEDEFDVEVRVSGGNGGTQPVVAKKNHPKCPKCHGSGVEYYEEGKKSRLCKCTIDDIFEVEEEEEIDFNELEDEHGETDFTAGSSIEDQE